MIPYKTDVPFTQLPISNALLVVFTIISFFIPFFIMSYLYFSVLGDWNLSGFICHLLYI